MRILKFLAAAMVAVMAAGSLPAQRADSDLQAKAREALAKAEADQDAQGAGGKNATPAPAPAPAKKKKPPSSWRPKSARDDDTLGNRECLHDAETGTRSSRERKRGGESAAAITRRRGPAFNDSDHRRRRGARAAHARVGSGARGQSRCRKDSFASYNAGTGSNARSCNIDIHDLCGLESGCRGTRA